jgi:hypothetical protein
MNPLAHGFLMTTTVYDLSNQVIQDAPFDGCFGEVPIPIRFSEKWKLLHSRFVRKKREIMCCLLLSADKVEWFENAFENTVREGKC